MLRDKDKGDDLKDYQGSYYEEVSVEEVILEAPEFVEEPIIVEKVVVPVDPLSKKEQEDADAWAMVEEIKAEAAAKKNVVAPSLPKTKKADADAWALVEEIRAEAAAKKKRAGIVDNSAEVTAVFDARKAEVAKKIKALYTVGEWEGKPNYECKVCPYKTLDMELMKTHVKRHV